jgi:hypothetical protein
MVAARALKVPGDHKLNKQPIFCFETMMHMLYWSSIVYDYKRVCCCATRARQHFWCGFVQWSGVIVSVVLCAKAGWTLHLCSLA